ncbi:MAG: putative toxin-antitoxin system toxin component, PIN family [Caldilineaceae bacterium]
MRVVLDTNVLISALISSQGAPAQIFSLWRSGDIEIIASHETLDELKRVLAYPKIAGRLRYTGEQVRRYLELLYTTAEVVEDAHAVSELEDAAHIVEADPEDDKFFAVALAAQAQFIVSGDKAHVLPMSQYQGIQVVSPAHFLQIVADGSA